MNTTHSRRHVLVALRATLTALALVASGATGLTTGVSVAASSTAPIVSTQSGAVQGMTVPGGYAFLGLPYAAPPTGNLRWRAPRRPSTWTGIRDATQFAPSCPQQPSLFAPPGPMSEDCLYLNVYTPTLGSRGGGEGNGKGYRPVLVWIHGGGLAKDGGRNYDPTKLMAEDGIVVITINYRLGALGFLAHPALASRPGGPAGNYGLMDQQAALRWVQRNIAQFGGNPHNVTIAGQSAGGLSVLAQLVSPRARGLFQRAIVESGAFALTQQSLASAEAFGESFATQVGCADQSAACLRSVPVSTLVKDFPGAAIPGVVDGKVLTESIGTALAAGRFTHVPVLDGTNHDEERLFVADQGVAVSGGTFVGVPNDTYQNQIAAVLGVSNTRAAAIAAEYPVGNYYSQTVALSTLVADANFACPAFQVDTLTSQQGAPTFAYEFNDDTAPPRYAPTNPPVATHGSELPYIFDLPNAPIQAPFSPDQETLAASMRAAWASFAATGDPSTAATPWPSFGNNGQVMSLVPPQPQVETSFATNHHCAFWAAG